MKNKIILLLVLLIPSLCFGESVKFNFQFIKMPKVNTLVISVTHSSLLQSDGEKHEADHRVFAVGLNSDDEILHKPKGQEPHPQDYEGFQKWLKAMFPIHYDFLKKRYKPNENIISFVEKLMIFNGYTLVNTGAGEKIRYYFK